MWRKWFIWGSCPAWNNKCSSAQKGRPRAWLFALQPHRKQEPAPVALPRKMGSPNVAKSGRSCPAIHACPEMPRITTFSTKRRHCFKIRQAPLRVSSCSQFHQCTYKPSAKDFFFFLIPNKRKALLHLPVPAWKLGARQQLGLPLQRNRHFQTTTHITPRKGF